MSDDENAEKPCVFLHEQCYIVYLRIFFTCWWSFCLGNVYLSSLLVSICGAFAGAMFTCEWIFSMSSVYLRILYVRVFLLEDLLHEQCLLEHFYLRAFFLPRKLRERVLLKNVCVIDHQELTTAT